MFRSYTPSDLEQLRQLIRLNTPTYFDPSEEQYLEGYLAQHGDTYWVFVQDEILVGAGGHLVNKDPSLGRVAWYFIHPDYQGQGIGRRLLAHNLELLSKMPQVEKIEVHTSQLVYPFFAKAGFTPIQIVVDYWAPGFDLYLMEKQL